MALFGREQLPARSTLSRFLAALSSEPVEALRALFLSDLLARPLDKEEHVAGLLDRQRTRWIVFDVDGTREAARQRALPKTADRPAPSRRLRSLCAPGYTGRKRGEVVRTRTTVLQAHTHQWLASFGNPGNGQYRAALRRTVAAIQSYVKAHGFSEKRAILRLDGQYGTGAVVSDLAGFSYVTRGKDYRLLDRAEVQARLHLPADQQLEHPESGMVRTLYDGPDQSLGKAGKRVRIIVATHQAQATRSRVGLTRAGLVYELFLTDLPQSAFTAADVVSLYLHRPRDAQRDAHLAEVASQARSILSLFSGKRSEIPLPYGNTRAMKDASCHFTDEVKLVAHPVGWWRIQKPNGNITERSQES
jgi:hypothetical protein